MKDFMRASLCALVALMAFMGCGETKVARPEDRAVMAKAFRDFDRVWDACATVVDRYAVILTMDRQAGRIVGLRPVDASYADKTRTQVWAEVYRRGEIYDVELRVVTEVEQSEPADHGVYLEPYDWRRVSFDSEAEAQLLAEVHAILLGDEYKKKKPLNPIAKPAPPQPQITAEEADLRQIEETLATTTLDLEADHQSLADLVDVLRQHSGLNFAIEPRALTVAGPISLKLKGVALESVLRLALDQAHPDLTYTVAHGAVYIYLRAPRPQAPASEKSI